MGSIMLFNRYCRIKVYCFSTYIKFSVTMDKRKGPLAGLIPNRKQSLPVASIWRLYDLINTFINGRASRAKKFLPQPTKHSFTHITSPQSLSNIHITIKCCIIMDIPIQPYSLTDSCVPLNLIKGKWSTLYRYTRSIFIFLMPSLHGHKSGVEGGRINSIHPNLSTLPTHSSQGQSPADCTELSGNNKNSPHWASQSTHTAQTFHKG